MFIAFKQPVFYQKNTWDIEKILSYGTERSEFALKDIYTGEIRFQTHINAFNISMNRNAFNAQENNQAIDYVLNKGIPEQAIDYINTIKSFNN